MRSALDQIGSLASRIVLVPLLISFSLAPQPQRLLANVSARLLPSSPFFPTSHDTQYVPPSKTYILLRPPVSLLLTD
jgi:hypothetical protein